MSASNFPCPCFPHYLFNEFAGSRQGGGQVPAKPDYLTKAGGGHLGQVLGGLDLDGRHPTVLDGRSIRR